MPVVFLLILGLTACRDNPQAKFDWTGINHSCQDKLGDAETNEFATTTEMVRVFTDIKSAHIETGEFDTNSNDLILLVAIEMVFSDNPVSLVENSGTTLSRGVVVTLLPHEYSIHPDGTQHSNETHYEIAFEWTATKSEPSVKVTEIMWDPDYKDTLVYETNSQYLNGQFAVGIPVTVFANIGKRMDWSVFAVTTMGITYAGQVFQSSDECDGGTL